MTSIRKNMRTVWRATAGLVLFFLVVCQAVCSQGFSLLDSCCVENPVAVSARSVSHHDDAGGRHHHDEGPPAAGQDADSDGAKPACCDDDMLPGRSTVDAPRPVQIESGPIVPILPADLAHSVAVNEVAVRALRAPPPLAGGTLSSVLLGPLCLPNGPPHPR